MGQGLFSWSWGLLPPISIWRLASQAVVPAAAPYPCSVYPFPGVLRELQGFRGLGAHFEDPQSCKLY